MATEEHFDFDHIHTTPEGRHFRHGDGQEMDGDGNPVPKAAPKSRRNHEQSDRVSRPREPQRRPTMTATTRYAIETLYHVGHASNWERLPDQDGFDSREEAEKAIEQLRELGDDWESAEYRVVEA